MKYILKRLLPHWQLIFFCGLFLLQVLPHWGLYPLLDSMVKYDQGLVLAKSGFQGYITHYASVSPPFQVSLIALLYTISHSSLFAENIPAAFFAILSIIFLYKILKKYTSSGIAFWITFLYSINPLFVVTNISFMDYTFITELGIIALYFLSENNIYLYIIFTTLAVLSKEPALLFPAAVCIGLLFYTFTYKKGTTYFFKRIGFYASPVIFYLLWVLVLKLNHKPSTWHEWVFASNSAQNLYLLIAKNIITLNFFTVYMLEDWYHLFVFNFNWLFTLSILTASIVYTSKEKLKTIKQKLYIAASKSELPYVLGIFFILYIFLILTFPTWTIPRYILPVLPLLLYVAVRSLFYLFKQKAHIILGLFVCIFFIATYYSFDPVTSFFMGKTDVLGIHTYAMHQTDGVDGYTYNMQFGQVLSYNEYTTNIIFRYKFQYVYSVQQIWYLVSFGIKEPEEFTYLANYGDSKLNPVTFAYLNGATKGNNTDTLFLSQTPLTTVLFKNSIEQVKEIGRYTFNTTHLIYFYLAKT